MPKTLLQKALGDGKKLLHPKSRKAAQFSRQLHRDVRVRQKKKEHHIKIGLAGDKVVWFKDHLEDGIDSCTPEMVLNLIEEYLGRFDEELEQIDIKNQVGARTFRQHASREDTVKHTQELERQEFEGPGLEIPDILSKATLDYLKTWNGQLRFLQNIPLKRYRKKELLSKVSESSTKDVMEVND